MGQRQEDLASQVYVVSTDQPGLRLSSNNKKHQRCKCVALKEYETRQTGHPDTLPQPPFITMLAVVHPASSLGCQGFPPTNQYVLPTLSSVFVLFVFCFFVGEGGSRPGFFL